MFLTWDPLLFPLKVRDLNVTSVTIFALKNKKRIFPSKMKENSTFWGVFGRKWVKMGSKNAKIGPKRDFFRPKSRLEGTSMGTFVLKSNGPFFLTL